MTIDLKAPEVQDAIRAAVEEATGALKTKNEELVGEVRKLRKGKEIDPAEHDKALAEVDRLTGELDAANKATKAAKTDAEKAAKTLATEQGFTHSLLVDNGLSDALVKAGVKEPAHIKAVKAMLAPLVQIHVDGDKRVAKVGDKALADHIGDWAKSDEGKFFVTAQHNSGGGAGGGNGGGGPAVKPNMGGNQQERTAAIKQRFPDLESSN